MDILSFFCEVMQHVFSFLSRFSLVPMTGIGGGVEVQESISILPLLRTALIFMAFIAGILGIGLALAARVFFVASDPKVEDVKEVLAHAHCGACGYAGCEQYAQAVVKNPEVPPNLCTPGGRECTEQVGAMTGKLVKEREPVHARILCRGDNNAALKRSVYQGVKDCNAAVLLAGGDKVCRFGCLGYGTCARVCPFEAITMQNGLPVIDTVKCVGCGKCAAACPKKLITILPASAAFVVACRSEDKGAAKRKYCTTACIGCGKCAKVCPSEAIRIENGLARIELSKCTACGTCAAACPTKAITGFFSQEEKPESILLKTTVLRPHAQIETESN